MGGGRARPPIAPGAAELEGRVTLGCAQGGAAAPVSSLGCGPTGGHVPLYHGSCPGRGAPCGPGPGGGSRDAGDAAEAAGSAAKSSQFGAGGCTHVGFGSSVTREQESAVCRRIVSVIEICDGLCRFPSVGFGCWV